VAFILSTPSPRLLQTAGVPHLHFPPYTKEESIKILSLDPPAIFTRPVDDEYDYGEEEEFEDRQKLWPRYCSVVWDAVARSAARDLYSFRDLCMKLWRPFVQPIVDGHFGTHDIHRLIVNRRPIFQSEEPLVGGLVSNAFPIKSKTGVNELPYYAKYLLCAAYLASYNPAKVDQIYFMKSAERKRKKRAGGVLPGRRPKHRKVSGMNTAESRLIIRFRETS
jgi:origin recognition complex subunit 5